MTDDELLDLLATIDAGGQIHPRVHEGEQRGFIKSDHRALGLTAHNGYGPVRVGVTPRGFYLSDPGKERLRQLRHHTM